MTTNSDPLTLTLSIDETNAVLAGLQELPAKIANPITQKIQSQAAYQLSRKSAAQGPEEGASGIPQ